MLLSCLSNNAPSNYRLPCIALAHNERHIFPEFLSHYRKLGVDHFFIVDDRSTDHSEEYLLSQPDVTIFTPVESSLYARDKRDWRAELLNKFADGKWAVVPDIDEHLVYRDYETRNLHALIVDLEQEGAEAFHATMIDMYRDEPLIDHYHDKKTLLQSFPLFYGPDHYFRIAAPRRYRQEYPTPPCMVIGGLRQRLFEPLSIKPGSWEYAILRRACDMSGSLSGGHLFQFSIALTRMRLRRVLKPIALYNNSKLPLIKWNRNMRFSGGAHAISTSAPLSKQTGALLHFKFAGGMQGIKYLALRGQHTGDSVYYKRIIDQREIASLSPAFFGSQTFQQSSSLGRIAH